MALTQESVLIKGASVWQNKRFECLDVFFAEGKIQSLVKSGTKESILFEDKADEVVDAEGSYLMPGLCDLHVHFREPGQEYKETIKTGSRSAAAGGFTAVCTMPNLNPTPDSVSSLQQQFAIIDKDSCIDIFPYASITRGRKGEELTDYASIIDSFPGRIAGFSDDGTGVQDKAVMLKAMEGISSVKSLLAAHCEVEDLLHDGYIHEGEYCREYGHRGICSESEWGEVKRDIELSERTGCRLHICHVSTKESVDLIRKAKKEGLKVTCETAPHYLAFSEKDLREDGKWKMNPPLRGVDDRLALLRGLKDGTIDAIATDHAPHSYEEKSKGLSGSAMGVVGLETAISAVYTFAVLPGYISVEEMVCTMCDNPRRIIDKQLEIKPGAAASVTLFNPNITWMVNPADFVTKGRATPFDNITLRGRVTDTWHNGIKIF